MNLGGVGVSIYVDSEDAVESMEKVNSAVKSADEKAAESTEQFQTMEKHIEKVSVIATEGFDSAIGRMVSFREVGVEAAAKIGESLRKNVGKASEVVTQKAKQQMEEEGSFLGDLFSGFSGGYIFRSLTGGLSAGKVRLLRWVAWAKGIIISGFSTAWSTVAGLFSSMFSGLASTIGTILTPIGGAITVYFARFFSEFGERRGQGIIGGLSSFFGQIGDMMSSLWEGNLTQLKAQFFNFAFDVAVALRDSILEPVQAVTKWFGVDLYNGLEAVGEIVSGTLTAAWKGFLAWIQIGKAAFSTVISSYISGVTAVANFIKKLWFGMFDRLISNFQAVTTFFASSAEELGLTGMAEDMRSVGKMAEEGRDKMKNFAESGIEEARQKSRDWAKTSREARSEARKLGEQVRGEMSDSWDKMIEKGAAAETQTKGVDESAASFKEQITSVVSGVANFTSELGKGIKAIGEYQLRTTALNAITNQLSESSIKLMDQQRRLGARTGINEKLLNRFTNQMAISASQTGISAEKNRELGNSLVGMGANIRDIASAAEGELSPNVQRAQELVSLFGLSAEESATMLRQVQESGGDTTEQLEGLIDSAVAMENEFQLEGLLKEVPGLLGDVREQQRQLSDTIIESVPEATENITEMAGAMSEKLPGGAEEAMSAAKGFFNTIAEESQTATRVMVGLEDDFGSATQGLMEGFALAGEPVQDVFDIINNPDNPKNIAKIASVYKDLTGAQGQATMQSRRFRQQLLQNFDPKVVEAITSGKDSVKKAKEAMEGSGDAAEKARKRLSKQVKKQQKMADATGRMAGNIAALNDEELNKLVGGFKTTQKAVSKRVGKMNNVMETFVTNVQTGVKGVNKLEDSAPNTGESNLESAEQNELAEPEDQDESKAGGGSVDQDSIANRETVARGGIPFGERKTEGKEVKLDRATLEQFAEIISKGGYPDFLDATFNLNGRKIGQAQKKAKQDDNSTKSSRGRGRGGGGGW